MLAPWIHELATFATLTAAGVWLMVQFMRTATSAGGPGCARCEQAPALARAPARAPVGRGLRSKQLRVIG